MPRRRAQLSKRLQAKADAIIARRVREQRALPDVAAIIACWPSAIAGALSYLIAENDIAARPDSHTATAMRLLAIAADRVGPLQPG